MWQEATVEGQLRQLLFMLYTGMIQRSDHRKTRCPASQIIVFIQLILIKEQNLGLRAWHTRENYGWSFAGNESSNLLQPLYYHYISFPSELVLHTSMPWLSHKSRHSLVNHVLG